MKKQLYILFWLFGYPTIYGQTALISHKSHSGTAVNYAIDPSTNFGDPGPQKIYTEVLNDSTIVDHYGYSKSTIYFSDTIHLSTRQPKTTKIIDSLKTLQQQQTPSSTPKEQYTPSKTESNVPLPLKTHESNKKGKRKSSGKKNTGWLLVAIGGLFFVTKHLLDKQDRSISIPQ